MKGAGNTDARN